jgi:hypothetical protein
MLNYFSITRLISIISTSTNDVWRNQALDELLTRNECNVQAFCNILASINPPRTTEYDEFDEVDLLDEDREIDNRLIKEILKYPDISTEQLFEAMKSTVSEDSRIAIQKPLIERVDITCDQLVVIRFEYACDDDISLKAEKLLVNNPNITTHQLCLAGCFFLSKSDRAEAILKLQNRPDTPIEYLRNVIKDIFPSNAMHLAALTVLIDHPEVTGDDLTLIANNTWDILLASRAKEKLGLLAT